PRCSTLFPYTTLFRSWSPPEPWSPPEWTPPEWTPPPPEPQSSPWAPPEAVGAAEVIDADVVDAGPGQSMPGPDRFAATDVVEARSEEHTSELQSRENL